MGTLGSSVHSPWTEVGLLHPLPRLSSNSLAPLQTLQALHPHVNCFSGCLSPMVYSSLDEEQIRIDLRRTQAVNNWS